MPQSFQPLAVEQGIVRIKRATKMWRLIRCIKKSEQNHPAAGTSLRLDKPRLFRATTEELTTPLMDGNKFRNSPARDVSREGGLGFVRQKPTAGIRFLKSDAA